MRQTDTALSGPRLVSNNLGQQAAYHVCYPYGEEATAFNQDTIREKFTGHERDLGNPGGAGDDLDYMHARHESSLTGRFLSMDPILDMNKAIALPQSWNRYAYVRNNPQNFTDPKGEYLCAGTSENCSVISQAIKDIGDALSNLPEKSGSRTDLQSILTFYGREGVDNGVTVRVGGNQELGSSDSQGGKATISVNLALAELINGGRETPKFRAEIASTIAHEGRHGIDDKRLGNPSTRSMEKRTELNAARSEAYVYEGLRVDAPWHTWTQATGISRVNIEREAEASTKAWCAAGGNCR